MGRLYSCSNICSILNIAACRGLFLGLASTGTMDPVLRNIHRMAQRGPHLAWRIAGCESVGSRQSELIQNNIAHEGAAEMLSEFGRDREGEFGMLHPFSVTGLPVEFW